MNTLENLRKSLNVKVENGKKTLKHNINKKVNIFPFQTRNPERAKFKNGFSPVIGQFFRNIEGVKLTVLEKEEFVKVLTNQVNCRDEDRPHLVRIITSYLFQADTLRIFHPSIYKYIELSSSKEATGEKEIAQYIYDALLGGEVTLFEEFLLQRKSEHVLSRLIIDNLPKLEHAKIENKYAPTLPFIRKLFLKDLQFLLTNREFFMQYINLFFAYYYFYSITQMVLKINQFEKMDPYNPTPIYYNLDWERTSRNRPAVTHGYKHIFTNARKVLTHVNTLEHLNFIFNTENKHYIELVEEFNRLNPLEQQKILDAIYTWTKEYTEIKVGNMDEIERKPQLEEAMRQLQQQIAKGLSQETLYRYALAVNEIGKAYFLKTRGSLGNTLNVTQDFLILLTAISVKDTKIPLNQYFKELENRGVFFDRYSQEEIIELLNKLNLIEKKSDSGDAQYVKPIL